MAKLFEQYPELLAVGFVLVGFVAAYFMSRLVLSLAQFAGRYLKGVLPERSLDTAMTRFIARVAYFIVLIFFLTLALRSLGISGLGGTLEDLLAFVPRLLIAATIVVGGYLLGLLVRSLVSNLIGEENQLLPVVLQYSVVVIAILTGLEQVAIELKFLVMLTTVLFAAVLGSVSLAFALGSKDLVANMLASRELNRYTVGDYLQLGEVSGHIIEINQTAVVLASEEGSVVIPATLLANSIVVHNPRGAGGE
jgi:small-conductance mechanosensitive channel